MSTATRPVLADTIEDARRGGHDAPEVEARHAGDSTSGFVLWLVGGTLALLLAVLAFNMVVDPYGGLGTGVFPTAVTDDPAVKVHLLEDLPAAPKLVVLGSSRSLKADPHFLQQQTGLPTFNAGVRGGTTVEAYLLSKFIHDRWPDAGTRYVWLIDIESFRWGSLDPSLLNTSELAGELPLTDRIRGRLDAVGPLLSWNATRDSLRVVRAEVDGTEAAGDQTGSRREDFRPDGYLLRNGYDPVYERRRYLNIYRNGGFSHLEPQPLAYLRRTVGQMAKWGTPPLIVLTPIAPDLLAELRTMGWDSRYRDLLAELHRLAREDGATVVDMSRISDFDGTPGGFYDGVHLRPVNMRKMLAAVLQAHPDALQ